MPFENTVCGVLGIPWPAVSGALRGPEGLLSWLAAILSLGSVVAVRGWRS